MISTSQNYKNLLSDKNTQQEWRVDISGTIYGKEYIDDSSRPKISRHLFSGGEPSLGDCVASQFDCTLRGVAVSAIPRMATVKPSFRLVNGNQTSEWVTMGTFFVDVKTPDKASGKIKLVCYDAMLKADGDPYVERTSIVSWPQSMSNVVRDIAGIMGLSTDSRNVINSTDGYSVSYPNDLTAREVLGYIAAAHGGCFTITHDNKLRLVPITGTGDSLDIGWRLSSLKDPVPLPAWTGVTVYYDDESAYDAGTDAGRVVEIDDPWAIQETANGLLAVLQNHSYVPFTAQGAIIDLAAELGDSISIGGSHVTDKIDGTTTGLIFEIDTTCGGLSRSNVAAPGEAEVDHEYSYQTATEKAIKRRLTLGKAYYGVTISRTKGIEIKRSDGLSEALFNSDRFTMRALIDGVMKDRIYFDPVKGDYVFDGALGATAVFTESLYAEQGDIAELTVDRLSTSRRVRKYILQDTSDDNYISIREQYLQFITGTTDGSETEQATNRWGTGLYWQREPVNHNADGYPLDEDGAQIYATTDITQWPVTVYKYTDLIKRQILFADDGTGTYVPIDIFGAGDGAGGNQGTLGKATNEMALSYVTTEKKPLGIKFGNGGYTDIIGLRKAKSIDFSSFDYGMFSETLDGDVDVSYSVEFDADNRPIKISDVDGHECVITWESESGGGGE